jgi:bifunctional non-homologous end joining protein LigD
MPADEESGRSGRGATWLGLPSVQPMMAVLGELPGAARDAEYGYEIKWDGVRAAAYLSGDGFALVSRNGNEITAAYPELAAHRPGAGGGLVLDGEIVAFDESGRPSFEALQPRMHLRDEPRIVVASRDNPVAYVVFDVMRFDGRDVTRLAYSERRALLDRVGVAESGVGAASGPGSASQRSSAWQLFDYQAGGGARLLDATRLRGLEGVIAKRLDSPYRAGRRSRDWLKIKNTREQEVVVGGWTPGEGHRADTFGALLLGVPSGSGASDSGLRFVGHVGTGFSDRTLADIKRLLTLLAARESPFIQRVPSIGGRRAHWVRPELVGEVTYLERTREGLLRAPAWRGLRPDKSPSDIHID